MFHIKKDRRAQTSAHLIVEGLYKCLEKKPFDKITIVDIHNASGVGRATFYRLFDRLPDVLAYECNNVLDRFIRTQRISSTEEMFSNFFSYWMAHSKLLEAIITSDNSELFYTAYRKHSDDLKKILSPSVQLTSGEVDFLVSIATSALLGSLATWLRHDKRETPEELTKMMKVSLITVTESLKG